MSSKKQKSDELYCDALELQTGEQRDAFLKEACGELTLERVQKLLDARTQAEVFWQKAAATSQADEANTSAIAERPGQKLGAYLLQEQIGEGGMGVVFVALQTEPIKRRVAVKIVKPGMDSRQVVARFEAERQALALMEHPHIARVFDAGTTPAGRPFFVMELVRGIRITKFCEQHQFDVRQRLQLFVQVCYAVQHAHQKGIIHRDLKPSNILVELHDVTAVPKIIDFGIAKAMSGANPGFTVYTGFHEVMGTPMYMSPEQAEFNALDIDTRSDVYALGVLLYELLTNESPFDRDRLREASFPELFRIIREESPPRPSTRRSRDRKSQSVDQSTRIDTLQKRFRGELDWVVMKAIEKDRTRRYQSAAELADDIDRFLHHQEVHARPPSLWYRSSKLVRRHKGLVTGVVCVFLTLIVGLLATLWQSQEASSARERADLKSAAFAAARDEALRLKKLAEESRADAEHQLFLADMRLASTALQAGDIPRVRSLLDAHRQTDSGGQKIALRMLDELTHATALWNVDFLAPVQGLDLNAAGDRLAVATRDSRIHLMDVVTGNVLFSFISPSECNSVRWHPQKKMIVAAGADGAIRCFSVHDRLSADQRSAVTSLLNLAGIPSVVSPDCTYFLHNGEANDCLFSPDGQHLISCGDDGFIRICAVDDGSVQHTLNVHSREVEQLALSTDGTFLASASSDGSVHLQNLVTNKSIRRLRCSPFQGRIVCVSFSGDDRYLAAGDVDGHVVLTDTKDGGIGRVFQIDGIESLTFDRSGSTLITGNRGGALRTWSILNNREGRVYLRAGPRHWQAHPSYAQAVVCFGSGSKLISGGRDGSLRAWPDLEAMNGWGHNQSTLAYWRSDDQIISYGHEVYELDIRSNRKLKQARLPQTNQVNRWYTIDSPMRLVLETPNKSIAIYDWESQQQVAQWSYPHDLSEVALSVDGNWLAASEYDERYFVNVYRVGEAEPVHRLAARQCSGLRFSQDASMLVVSAQDDVLIYDLKTGNLIGRLRGHESTVEYFAFSPDQSRLASVSHDRRLIVWDVGSGKIVRKTRAHLDNVTCVDWSPDGSTIATTSRDDKLRLWDAESLQPFFEYDLPSDGMQAAFSPNGKALLVRTRHEGIAVLGTRRDGARSATSTEPKPSLPARRTGTKPHLTIIEELDGGSSVQELVLAPDGCALWGSITTKSGHRLFRWSEHEGLQDLPFAPSTTAALMSGLDPFVVRLSSAAKDNQPVLLDVASDDLRRLSGFNGWDTLLVSDYFDDEQVQYVGYGSRSGGELWRAWRLADGEPVLLEPGTVGHHSAAFRLTADGREVLGCTWAGPAVGPSAKTLDLSVVRWDESGIHQIEALQGDGYNWHMTDCTPDGTVIVGERWASGTAPIVDGQDRRLSFHWYNGTLTLLGKVQPDHIQAVARAVSTDGRFVVGHTQSAGSSEAMIWDSEHGIRSLQTLAEAHGLFIGRRQLQIATDISADGTVVAGIAVDETGRRFPFLLRFPSENGQ